MKLTLVLTLLLGATISYAQAPQVPVTGNLGSGGAFPLINSPAVVFTSDANHTMAFPEMSGSSGVMVVTSSVSLTAARNLIAPLVKGFQFTIENKTTGGQSIQVIGTSGAGVTIANGSTVVVVCDGTNYLSASGTGGGGTVSSVFTRTGAVIAQTGDYTVSQVTGAAPLASPTFTGTPLAPTPSTSDNSTEIATTAYTRAYVASLSYVGSTGSITTGHCAEWASSTTLEDAGAACGTSSGLNQLTGDVSAGPGTGSQVATLATVNSSPGTVGDSTHTVTETVNGKGLVTALSANAIPTAASGTNGLGSPDNSTIKTSAGVYTVQSTTVNTVSCTPGGSCTIPVAICPGPTTSCAIQQINPAPSGSSTTLASTITTTQTTIPLVSAAGMVAPLIVAIDSTSSPIEWVGCTGISSNTLTGCTRNYYTSSPGTGVAWASGSNVTQMVLGYSTSSTATPYYFILQNGAIGYGCGSELAGKTCFQNASTFVSGLTAGGSTATGGEIASTNGAGSAAPLWTPNYIARNSNATGSGTCGWADYNFTGVTASDWDLIASNTDCTLGTNGVAPGVMGFAYGHNLVFQWDQMGDLTAPSVATNGTGPSGLTVTPNSVIPTAPSNSITYSTPLSVPTPYTFLPPTNVTSATSATPMQCTYAAGPPATLTCTLSSGLGNGITTGVNSGTFTCLTWSGSCASGADLGLLADTSGADKRLFVDVPTTGYHVFRIGNNPVFESVLTSGNYGGISLNQSQTATGVLGVIGDRSGTDPNLYVQAPSGGQIIDKINNANAFQVTAGSAPTGSCTGYFFVLSTADGHMSYCNNSTYSEKY